MINPDNLKRRLFKLTNRFPVELLATAFLLIYCYHDLNALSKGASNGIFNFPLFANAFFQSTVVTVLVYFYKSKFLAGTLNTQPSDFTKGAVQGFFPCIYGTWPHQYQSGFLILEDDMLRFYAKKVTGFAMTKEFCKRDDINLSTTIQRINPFTPVFFGQMKIIQLTTTNGMERFIFPQADECVVEIEEFLRSLNK